MFDSVSVNEDIEEIVRDRKTPDRTSFLFQKVFTIIAQNQL